MQKIISYLAISMFLACSGNGTSIPDDPTTDAQSIVDSGAINIAEPVTDAGAIQSDAGQVVPEKCSVTLCGVSHPEYCESQYGEVMYPDAGAGEANYCNTSDLNDHWQTCCAAWCVPGDDSTFEYMCGRTNK